MKPANELHEEQPAPVPGENIVLPHVLQDLQKRAEVGRARYGYYLRTFNGRDALRDAYEEALDCAMYLKQAIMERDAENAKRKAAAGA